MAEVRAVINEKHYATHISTATNSLVADEPVANGGNGEGFNPEELLAASLAACTSITCRMYVDRKGYKVDKIEVNISVSRNAEQSITNIHRDIIVHGELTAGQKERLLQIANNCPVHKILSNQISINTDLL
jgi:putative redox protein